MTNNPWVLISLWFLECLTEFGGRGTREKITDNVGAGGALCQGDTSPPQSMKPVVPVILFLSVLPVAARAQAPDSGAWLRRLGEARAVLGQTSPGEVEKARFAKWQELAVAFPVITDWILQDSGADAIGLLDPERHEAVTARLLAKSGQGDHGPETTDGGLPAGDKLARYVRFAGERRKTRLDAVIARWGGVAFTEGHSYKMSFIGYTEGLSDARHERFFRAGAKLSLLEFPSGDTFGQRRALVDDPHGMMRDVDIAADRQRLLFAWKKSDRLDDYHLYEIFLKDGTLRQLTTGLGRADYEGMYLPDGDILFTSTRPEQSVPCWWTEISNLYRMNRDGQFIRRLAVDQVHALYPQLMADGRVTYTRWDYNDRGQNFPHPVFSMKPDGQDQRAFYGGNSWFPTSLLHTRGIPGSHKAMAIAAGHHTPQQGKLVVLDPMAGRDEGPGMSFIAPRRDVPYERKDVAMQHGDQFRYPYPLSDTSFLISYRPAWGSERFGLYWMNADGERELLHVDARLDVARMVPLGHKPEIAHIPDTVDHRKRTATYYVHDVYQGVGLAGIARGSAKKIRVVRLNYRAAGVGQTNNAGEGGGSLNSSPVAIGNGSWDVKEILGDAEIHADGSALFEVPAMESIYLQVLDARGRVIQTSRTWDTLQPGEQKACVGCHDKSNGNFHPFAKENTMAWRHGAQKLRPFHGEPRGFSFAREVQPILDARCIVCHDGSKPEAMDLRGEPEGGSNLNLREWTRSYLNLVEATRDKNGNFGQASPETSLAGWISKMSRPTEIPPYFAGAAKSRLLDRLDAGHHEVKLTGEEYEKLAAWIDLLVPFCGDYREGNMWSAKQMAYYNYYEGKRGIQAKEEFAAVAAYLNKGKDGKAAALPPADGFLTARYREVLLDQQMIIRDDRARLPGTSEPVMIDRLWIRAAGGPAGSGLPMTFAKLGGGKALAEATIVPEAAATLVLLAEPVRSDRLEIHVKPPAAHGVSIHVDRAMGVLVKEVPVMDNFHPYLDLTPPPAGP